MKKIPPYGDLMTSKKFIQYCVGKWFIDYDGYGYYSDGKILFDDFIVYPSDIIEGKINYIFSHVVWFNR